MKNILFIVLVTLSIGQIKAQTLKEYLTIALENNPGVMAKYKAFEASIERANQSRVLPDPNFSVGYFISPVETRVGPQRARFSLSQMFPWFGTLAAKGEVKTLLAEAEYQAYLDARNRLFFEVVTAYYPLIERKQITMIEEDNLELLRAIKEVAQSNFETGSGSLSDILQLDIKIKDLNTRLNILKKQERPLVISFNKKLNRENEAEVNVPDSVNSVEQFTISEADFENNPRVRELEIRSSAMASRQSLIEKQGLPSLGLGIDYVLVGERDDLAPGANPPEDNGKNAFMPMVTVSLPIFRKKYKSAKKEAELMETAYTLQEEQALNDLTSSFEQAAFEVSKQKMLRDSYNSQSNDARAALDLMYSSYQNGNGTVEDILSIQQILYDYQIKTVKAETAIQNAMARMNYLNATDYGIIENTDE